MKDFFSGMPGRTADSESEKSAQLVNGLQLQPETVMEFYEKYSAQTDSDKDGFITKHEIDYDSPRHLSWQEAQIFEGFELYMGDIEELSNDEQGDEKSGISRDDIETLVRDWDDESNLDLIRRLDYMSRRTFAGHDVIPSAYVEYKNDLRNFYGKAGCYTGLVAGAAVGGTLAETSGFLLAAAIPVGIALGGTYGRIGGEKFGEWRSSFTSYDEFSRSYVDKELGL